MRPDEKTVVYENWIRECFIISKQKKWTDPEAPLRVGIVAIYAIPNSAGKKKRAEMLTGKIYPTKKPDADNIAKVVLDALNGIAYPDDKQIVCCSCTKIYGEEPGVKVVIDDYAYPAGRMEE